MTITNHTIIVNYCILLNFYALSFRMNKIHFLWFFCIQFGTACVFCNISNGLHALLIIIIIIKIALSFRMNKINFVWFFVYSLPFCIQFGTECVYSNISNGLHAIIIIIQNPKGLKTAASWSKAALSKTRDSVTLKCLNVKEPLHQSHPFEVRCIFAY